MFIVYLLAVAFLVGLFAILVLGINFQTVS